MESRRGVNRLAARATEAPTVARDERQFRYLEQVTKARVQHAAAHS